MKPAFTRLAKRLLLLIAATAVSLKLADLAVGFVDPMGISHFTNKRRFDSTALKPATVESFQYVETIPGADVQAGVRYRINQLGMRGPERSMEKSDGVFRVLVLGDSVTFGWGVECADRFTDVVEARLREERPDGPPVEILNLSVPGYETIHHFQSWRRLGKDLDADAVVIAFNQNDVQLVADELMDLHQMADVRIGDAAWVADRLMNGWTSVVLQKTLPNLRNLALFNFIFATTPGDEQTLTQKFAEMKDGIRHSLDMIAKIRDAAAAQGARFALLDLQHFAAIEQGCVARGIPYRSICYDGYLADMTLRNSPADPHPNAAGHQRLADQFERALHELKLLPDEYLTEDAR